MNWSIEKKILNEMFEKSFCSAKNLSILCGISYKSVQNSINSINDVFKSRHYETRLISERGKGIYFNPKNENEIKSVISHFSNGEENINFLIIFELLNNNYTKIDDLSEKHHISRSNINRIILNIKDELKKNNISVFARPHYGLYISGDEKQIRQYMQKLLIKRDESLRTEMLHLNYDELFYVKENVVATICKYDVNISDTIIDQFILIVEIMLNRCNKKVDFEIETFNKNSFEYQLADRIANIINNNLSIFINEKEKMYLCECAKGFIRKHKDNLSDADLSSYINTLNKALNYVSDSYGYSFLSDAELITSLSIHMKALLTRAKNNNFISNPMLNAIKSYSLLAYDIAVDFTKIICEQMNITINDDEISYLAIYFHLAISREKNSKNKIKALVICPAGKGMSELFCEYLKLKYEEYIEKLVPCAIHNLDSVNFSDYDYAFSVVELEKELPIPLIIFDLNEDIKKISEIKNKISGKKSNRPLLAFFNKNLFFNDIKSLNKESVIKEIVKKISKNIKLNKDFYQSVMEREKIVSTELDSMIAIPHPIGRDMADRSFFSVTVLDKPIVWKDKKVCIILMSYIKGDSEYLNNFYESFAQFVSTNKFAIRLHNNPTIEQLYEIADEICN